MLVNRASTLRRVDGLYSQHIVYLPEQDVTIIYIFNVPEKFLSNVKPTGRHNLKAFEAPFRASS
jgi:hypothetical protein